MNVPGEALSENSSSGEDDAREAWHEAMRVFDDWADADASHQAKLIAADLGRHGRTAVHLKGGGLSLLVVKSEVNDIAAALGPTERLRSLLRKVGLG